MTSRRGRRPKHQEQQNSNWEVLNAKSYQQQATAPIVSCNVKRLRDPVDAIVKKLPQSPDYWDHASIKSSNDVYTITNMIVMTSLTNEIKGKPSWKDLFASFTHCFRYMYDNYHKQCVVGLKLAVFAVSDIAIRHGANKVEIEDLLRIFLQADGSNHEHTGEVIRKLRKATRESIKFVESVRCVFGARANELPFNTTGWMSAFLSYTADCRKNIMAKVRDNEFCAPNMQLPSGCLSTIHIVYLLLGGPFSKFSMTYIRDFFLPPKEPSLYGWEGPRAQYPAIFKELDFQPQETSFYHFLDVSKHRDILQKQSAAICEILPTMLVNACAGRYLAHHYSLPIACQEFLDAVLESFAVALNDIAKKNGRHLLDLNELHQEPLAFRSCEADTLWTTRNPALVLLLTNRPSDIILLDVKEKPRRHQWKPRNIMVLGNMGFAPFREKLHFIYAILPSEALLAKASLS